MVTEKEKMLLGKIFNYKDKEILRDSNTTNDLLTKFNNEKNNNLKYNIGKKIFGKYGKNSEIYNNFKCDFGYNIYLENNITINNNCRFLDVGKIKIGKYTMLGPSVSIYTIFHPIDMFQRRYPIATAKEVTIGEDCWIGGNVVICPGVKIGNNVIVAAGSVVVKDFPDNVMVAGNPARIVKCLNSNKNNVISKL